MLCEPVAYFVLLSSISFCEQAIVCLSTPLLIDLWLVSNI